MRICLHSIVCFLVLFKVSEREGTGAGREPVGSWSTEGYGPRLEVSNQGHCRILQPFGSSCAGWPLSFLPSLKFSNSLHRECGIWVHSLWNQNQFLLPTWLRASPLSSELIPHRNGLRDLHPKYGIRSGLKPLSHVISVGPMKHPISCEHSHTVQLSEGFSKMPLEEISEERAGHCKPLVKATLEAKDRLYHPPLYSPICSSQL